ncbi:VOC family protein [Anianabacter salinae]|uniref:VOC family protein n=1 Tax=Anianabacter salinae TaxID=2851023 RepID=UPI00225DFEBE|nr:VOC family protein [Anianabacter salinae]MBV0913083.1 VOC family protein [Anianabacter salinae]
MANRDHPVCWTEIPVTDLSAAQAFYSKVFGFEFFTDDTGPNPVAMIRTKDDNGVAGHLYPGKPAPDGAGPTVHFVVESTLEDAITRCTDAGGTVLSPAITIPPGRFAYALDLDGNSIGLFEPAGA